MGPGPLPLFSPEGDAALDALAAHSTLYAFDYDGTLAPIVPRPDGATVPAEAIAALERLAALAPLAIVTGRSVADLRRRLSVDVAHVVGNHGAEGMPDEEPVEARAKAEGHARVVKAWAAQWADALATHSDDPGIFIEDKGRSLSVHYRAARDPDEAVQAVRAAVAQLVPAPRVIGGKRVFNLMPADAADKGEALVRLVRHAHCDACFFIGDDETDEHGFARAASTWVTVRVGRVETSAARFFVDDQRDVVRCIERIVERIEARPAVT